MECNTLLQLLNTDGWVKGTDATMCSSITAHLRSCATCCRGTIRLSKAIVTKNILSCDQCQARLAEYYEATRPHYALMALPDVEIAQVALHLAYCAVCSEEYEELCLLAELEERGELMG